MMAGLKELKNWVNGIFVPSLDAGEEDYRKIEFSVERHLHTPEVPRPITYQEEAQLKMVKYH
ncbi:hypothetical protein CDO73_04855 [Saccharibacillus sp. O23]|uniref:hypothetical protein n=1 Tax=Saccharibacillus sp. O23 TaxID=2009338 RepID=UPI000B4E09CB|nr:hypothetical protein [Saccharibacillus sp. O23]OWR31813.1 hypothetical protein CDO73_04855 [Saccharibacillus sp. O23]